MTKKEWKRRRLKRRIAALLAVVIVLGLIAGAVYFVVKELKKSSNAASRDDSMYLTVNGVTRTGEKSPLVGIIDVKDSGFKGLSGVELRNRYERADILNPFVSETVETAAHYCVGTDGVCIELIPLTERVPGTENNIVIVYSPEEGGEMPEEERKAIEDLLKELCDEYSIDEENVRGFKL
jgi:hypothetical protein